MGEECDEGTANNDNAACTDACEMNVCGDSLVLQGQEDCDDGTETSLCNADCTAAACGDGIVNASAGEVCEADVANGTCDGECKVVCAAGFASCDADPDCETPVWTDPATCGGCDLSCADSIACNLGICDGKRVFVTDATYQLAALTGLASIHAVCQAEADDAGLTGGTFRAWISDVAGPDGFAESTTPYVRVDGVVVANDYADLVDGTLSAAINLTAAGGVPSVDGMSCHGGTATCPFVYTGLTSAGAATGLNCGGWTDTGQTTTPGDMTKTDGAWSDAGLTLPCLPAARFYCFEQ